VVSTSLAVALVAASVAVGVVIGGRARQSRVDNKSSVTPTYTERQAANAKANVCASYQKIQQALDIAGVRNGGDDQTAILAVATGVRQVLDFGNRYLAAALAEEPATPPDLAREVRALSGIFQELTIGYLDGLVSSDANMHDTARAGDEVALTIQGLCK
jgi:hypothetical protein